LYDVLETTGCEKLRRTRVGYALIAAHLAWEVDTGNLSVFDLKDPLFCSAGVGVLQGDRGASDV
jgi:hypothetical protein